MAGEAETFPSTVELNVGGVFYTTTLSTLTKEPESLLSQIFTGKTKSPSVVKDTRGKYFIDRDGVLFRYVLDYLRNNKLVLPENFHEKERLNHEANYYQLPNMVKCINKVRVRGGARGNKVSGAADNDQIAENSDGTGEKGYITIGYRGTFAFGRDGLADVKFRKMSRLLVSGRVSLCKEVFGDTLNDSRDPDRGSNDRYTARYFLKHSFLEQAFDMLQEAGFELVGSCGSGTNNAGELKPGMDSEESKWNHYNEFIFCRQ